MNKTTTADPDTVARNARRVAEQHEDHEKAIDVEEDAYAELLEAVLEGAAPALPALVVGLPLDVEGEQLRGLVLVRGDDAEVWWLESDELVSFSGGATSPLEAAQIPAVYGRHGVVDAVMQVSIAIDAQLRGNRRKATEKILRRAEQVRALATLAKALS